MRSVLGSLAIEGNSLTLAQAAAVVEGKVVAASRKDVKELENAVQVYDRARTFRPARLDHLLAAHRMMMKGLIPDAGRFRGRGVGVFQGERVAHVAPPAKRVAVLMGNLLSWIKSNREIDGLIVSAVVHYELEFIHPFSDGNGRMGRLWQHVILLTRNPVFEWTPVESAIRERQEEYYRVLGLCDRAGQSTAFIEFSLSTVLDALRSFLSEFRPEPVTADIRLQQARVVLGDGWFSRKDYLNHVKTISTATASRDLTDGVKAKRLVRRGDKAQARYRFV